MKRQPKWQRPRGICRDCGWKWCPYAAGFERDGKMFPMDSEEAVFKFVGLACLPPDRRA